MAEHTPEPWVLLNRESIECPVTGRETHTVGLQDANDERIITEWIYTGSPTHKRLLADFGRARACVNALQGLNPEAVVGAVITLRAIATTQTTAELSATGGDAVDVAPVYDAGIREARAALATLDAK